jgi:thiamine biosynthesis lipoprotein
MGTTIGVLAPADRLDAPGIVRARFAEWEQVLSRFRPDSELSLLNARAGHAVEVSPLLFAVTTAALDAAAATDGVFDPALLRQLEVLGYDRTFEALTGTLPPPAAPPVPGGAWRRVRLDAAACTVRVPADAMLDFGGIAKGMAADAALRALAAAGIARAVVDAGGDAAVTPTPDGAEPWSVAVEAGDGERAIALRRGAIATSGISRRHWRQGEAERHHLLDPRTGLPADGALRSVSVIAPDCRRAEVAAKVAFILGADTGAAFIEAHGLTAMFVRRDGAQHLVGRWDPPDTEAAA